MFQLESRWMAVRVALRRSRFALAVFFLIAIGLNLLDRARAPASVLPIAATAMLAAPHWLTNQPMSDHVRPLYILQQTYFYDDETGHFDRVWFDYRSAQIPASSIHKLDKLTKEILKHDYLDIVLQGRAERREFSCDYGLEFCRQAALKLSERRAEAVRKYMLSKGVAADRLRVIGFGWHLNPGGGMPPIFRGVTATHIINERRLREISERSRQK